MPRITARKRNQRLRRELQELLAAPIENCSAHPLEDQLDVWHANIYVPALDANFHFEIRFPKDYPNVAPKVKNLTTIKHKNVFGSYICLDMLTMSAETANTPFRGWTSAYTISSLLVQLQSFLFEAMDECTKRNADKMRNSARAYTCGQCVHTGPCPWPPILCLNATPGKTATESTTEVECVFLQEAPLLVLECLGEFCDQQTVTKIRFLCEAVDSKNALDRVLKKSVYKCFYTLKDITHPDVVIGLGAKKDIMPRRSRKTYKKENQLQRLHCSFDYVSHEAYEMGLRNNVWKDRDFDSFIPLVINSEHAKKSIPVAEQCILKMWKDRTLDKTASSLTDAMILNTLSKVMNTTVVNMMKTVEDLEQGELQMFDSIKALEGYTSFHHLLLAFVQKYPSIKEIAQSRIKNFIENPLYRDKEITPDIGELLVCLSISDYQWIEFCPSWLEEVFIRNARWICSSYPNLLKLEESSSCVRLNQSWAATRTGKRLAMFQRFFVSEIACPKRLSGNPDKCKILLKEYNNRLGFPEEGMALKLQEHSRRVLACDNWFDYFTLVDFCPPCAPRLAAWMRNSIRVSAMKKYHSDAQILKYKDNHKVTPDCKKHFDQLNCVCTGSLYKMKHVGVCPPIKDTKDSVAGTLVEKAKTGVDVCFVLDCTGSMGSWISSAKRQIKNIIKKVNAEFDGKTRFSIVGYRDHVGQGSGRDKWVIKSHDFTSNLEKAQKNVDGFSADGGADYPEAMCCAMAEAHNMSWNRDSHQLVILIADAPCHGLGASGDSFPDGCECGEDTLRIVHTMAKTGIAVYTVDCGHDDKLRQTFFHALARITGGYALEMSEADLLPEIVLGAATEEKSLQKLAREVGPLYQQCLKSHPMGRFEQHCRSVFAELQAKKVTMKSVLPPDNYDETILHQIECLEYCMDLKQAKAMQNSEYFIPFSRKTKLVSGSRRPVTQAQVTKCMKRMRTKLAEENFMRHGCQYLNSERFTNEAFKSRWAEFKKEAKLKHFSPWNTIKTHKVRELSIIPDKRSLKTDTQARALASLGMKPNHKMLNKEHVGKTVEIKLNGTWTKVDIKYQLRGGKQFKGVDESGFDITVPALCEFRMINSFKGWGAKPEASKPKTAPRTVTDRPATDSAPRRAPAPSGPVPRRAPAPSGPVPRRAPVPSGPVPRRAPAPSGPAPRRAPAPSDPVSRRTPEMTAPRRTSEPRALSRPSAYAAPAPRFVPDSALLSMPMSTTPAHLSSSSSTTINFEGTDMPPVMPSPSRYMEPTSISTLMEKNTSIEVQESQIAESRRKASLTESGGSADTLEAPRRDRSNSRPRDSPFQIGKIVNVRNSDSEQWVLGRVMEVNPFVKVVVNGNAPAIFNQLAPAATREFYTCEDRSAVSLEFQGFAIKTSLKKNTCIQIVEFRENWAHIVSPVEGWIVGRKNGIKVIKSAKVWKKEQEEMRSKIRPNPVPTIIIEGVPERCTSGGLAVKCREMRLPAMPTRIRILGKGSDRKAIVEFDNKDSADHCYKVWCRSVTMRTMWDQGYLLYKESAI